jgi:hypothetical protein
MAFADLSSSSFAPFEGIRILLPGTLAITLYGAIVATYAPSAASPADNTLAAVIAALLLGLVLLYLDVPAKAAAYHSPDLPSRELQNWSIDSRPYNGAVNLYLVMLDVSFPPTIRSRALYTGAMFRIGFEGIYLVGLGSIGVLLTGGAFPEAGPARGATAATKWVLWAVVIAHSVAFFCSALAWFLHRRQRYDLRETFDVLKRDIADDFSLPEIAFLLLFPAEFLAWFVFTHKVFPGIAAVAIPAAAWAILFYRGRDQKENRDQPRRPLSPPGGSFLYGMACAFAATEAALRTGPGSALTTQAALGWGFASLIPAALIATRGHERKLIGSFRTQTTWMRMNRDDLVAAHKLRPTSPLTRPK